MSRLESFVLELRAKENAIPADSEELYRLTDGGFMLYSVGKNGVADEDGRTSDDLVLFSNLTIAPK